MNNETERNFLEAVRRERELQKNRGHLDEGVEDNEHWIKLVAKYLVRIRHGFDMNGSERYDFGTCLIRVAAICLAGYEWWKKREAPEEKPSEDLTDEEIDAILEGIEEDIEIEGELDLGLSSSASDFPSDLGLQ